ncbi:hypothetical protein CORC01_01554 [Colletotrichum orchidophilum]|uniref:Uncharacterized protein n=1 Tax=Colletotrichum orchidophilum TaxID=1209926 RepID=A0A1G4BNY4_9PEZI|nr:uncharacterized protein CORC01_01554 [Colletotrichum orchidophilum]OHF03170.1 hypothetical protein CORC01_01554 [Colletotrichum orchidophilum]
MCMRVFVLHRCLSPSNGGCDGYYAEYLEQQECNHMSLPGLPQFDCRAVWAGFEDEKSTKALHRDEYAKKARALCPSCLLRHRMAYVESEAQAERRGEYSDRMQAIIADLERRAELGRMDFMNRAYRDMWDAAWGFVDGLAGKADGVWSGIETALRRHFGASGMELAVVRDLIEDLKIAKRELLDELKSSTREMATALVGPNLEWQEDLEAQEQRVGGYIDDEWRMQRRAAVDASRERAEAQDVCGDGYSGFADSGR